MSTPAGPTPASERGEGIAGCELARPFPVGEYARALRSKLRSFVRVQLVGELVNMTLSRARGDSEWPASTGAMAGALWRREWETMAVGAEGAPSEGMQVVVAGGCDFYPGSAASSPGFTFAVAEMGVAGEGDLLAGIERLR